MKKIKILIVFNFLLFICSVSAQEGYYVEKDNRIKECQIKMIEVLIKDHQLKSNENGIKIKDYGKQMYVKKRIEFYNNNLLLVEFGSLADHARRYWSILDGKGKMFVFNNGDFAKDDIRKEYGEETMKLISCVAKYISEVETLDGE